MENNLAQAVGRELGNELGNALGRIGHCLEQLTDEQVWWRPAAGMNSIGNLLLHLTGNVRQWIVAGLGGAPDERDCPAEFSARGPLPKGDLWRALEETVEEARDALTGRPAGDWLRPRRIQGFEVTGL